LIKKTNFKELKISYGKKDKNPSGVPKSFDEIREGMAELRPEEVEALAADLKVTAGRIDGARGAQSDKLGQLAEDLAKGTVVGPEGVESVGDGEVDLRKDS
jgi:hypothetical protein